MAPGMGSVIDLGGEARGMVAAEYLRLAGRGGPWGRGRVKP